VFSNDVVVFFFFRERNKQPISSYLYISWRGSEVDKHLLWELMRALLCEILITIWFMIGRYRYIKKISSIIINISSSFYLYMSTQSCQITSSVQQISTKYFIYIFSATNNVQIRILTFAFWWFVSVEFLSRFALHMFCFSFTFSPFCWL